MSSRSMIVAGALVGVVGVSASHAAVDPAEIRFERAVLEARLDALQPSIARPVTTGAPQLAQWYNWPNWFNAWNNWNNWLNW